MKEHPWLIAAAFLYAVPVMGVAAHRLVGAVEEWCYCGTILRCVSCCFDMLL